MPFTTISISVEMLDGYDEDFDYVEDGTVVAIHTVVFDHGVNDQRNHRYPLVSTECSICCTSVLTARPETVESCRVSGDSRYGYEPYHVLCLVAEVESIDAQLGIDKNIWPS